MIICWGQKSYDWQKEGNTWYTTVDRFVGNTWKFGRLHQAKVLIDYDLKIDGKTYESPLSRPYVGICLPPGETRDEAMKNCVDFIEEYKSIGPTSVEDTFKFCNEYYSDIYPNRISIINHLFFTIGNGCDWLDGCIVDTSPYEYLESLARREENKEVLEAVAEVEALMKKQDKNYLTHDEERRMRWEAEDVEFYPVSKDYSNICQVPDDVKPDWLELAYEAALLLRDKSGAYPKMKRYNSTTEDEQKRQQENKLIGAEIVAQLERRFPHVKKIQQISSQET